MEGEGGGVFVRFIVGERIVGGWVVGPTSFCFFIDFFLGCHAMWQMESPVGIELTMCRWFCFFNR